MSKRVFVTLPDAVYQELEEWASKQGRSLSNLVAFLAGASLKTTKLQGDFVPDAKQKPFQR